MQRGQGRIQGFVLVQLYPSPLPKQRQGRDGNSCDDDAKEVCKEPPQEGQPEDAADQGAAPGAGAWQRDADKRHEGRKDAALLEPRRCAAGPLEEPVEEILHALAAPGSPGSQGLEPQDEERHREHVSQHGESEDGGGVHAHDHYAHGYCATELDERQGCQDQRD